MIGCYTFDELVVAETPISVAAAHVVVSATRVRFKNIRIRRNAAVTGSLGNDFAVAPVRSAIVSADLQPIDAQKS